MTSCHAGLQARALLLVCVFAASARAYGDDPPGLAIYRDTCAGCHGANGEGNIEEYPHPLQGNRTVEKLARLIQKTMPADDPGTLSAEQADEVADYIHQAFCATGPEGDGPRIELARLTVDQYRNAIADLVGSFREPVEPCSEQGLKTEYFKGRRQRSGDRVFERIEPRVEHDFGIGTPAGGEFDPYRFSIRWSGSLIAPETGEYEFIVHSNQPAQLYLNNSQAPFIDGSVRSGDTTEYRGTIFLLAGRRYPLRLDFSKAKQGVDDDKGKKPKDPPAPAFVRLAWKPPGQAEQVISARYLRTKSAPESCISATAFPPDDRSMGYERATSISKEWDQAATNAAIDTVLDVMARIEKLAGVGQDDADRAKKLQDFAARFAERAFRRPLDSEVRNAYVDRHFADAPDADTALKRSLLFILKSPRFLYREPGTSSDPYDTAARLAFAIWDSIPDAALLQAAAENRVTTREQVREQAQRMLEDDRARAKIRGFFFRWLRLDPAPELAKNTELYRGFDDALVSDLRTSLEIFLDEIVWSDASDYRQLLLAETVPLNGRLGDFYGVGLPDDGRFHDVRLNLADPAGLLSHPYVVANFAYDAASSPIHRGVFLARGVLGRTLRPPPEAAAPLAPDLHPSLSTRERVALQTSPESCMSCHGMINSLGFALENYDAVGRFRAQEKGKAIDAAGFYQTLDGTLAKFQGARSLAAYLAGSDEAHKSFVAQLFHYLIRQPIRAYGAGRQADFCSAFSAAGFSIRELVVDILTTASLSPDHQSVDADSPAN